jgi:hypothetical protein
MLDNIFSSLLVLTMSTRAGSRRNASTKPVTHTQLDQNEDIMDVSYRLVMISITDTEYRI